MRIGVVIQGSLLSQGFDCGGNVARTIARFSSNQNVAAVVLSTWEHDAVDFDVGAAVVLKHSRVKGKDFLNRRKQFLSTFEGVKYLKHNSQVTHVLKVRTDQELR